ncbi:hypothetical protein M9H77_06849 [Catharanthus roseus]|uniref:Uncharacterized protein n=1 Tax=Catharanthus roseus TaxID=4058 RepID=A0ACC0BTH7_CATRO|nr:hypothetical protein M9H77_06849 [Catharanthus roseus]
MVELVKEMPVRAGPTQPARCDSDHYLNLYFSPPRERHTLSLCEVFGIAVPAWTDSGRGEKKTVFVIVLGCIFIPLPEEYPESWPDEILAEKLGDAHSCLTLDLTDNVLREIDEKDNAFEI